MLAVAVVRQGRLTCISPGFRAIYSADSDDAAGGELFLDCVAPEDRPRVAATLSDSRRVTGRPLGFRSLRRDGRLFDAELSCLEVHLPDGPGTVILVQDVTERRRAEMRLSYLAFTDALTGLPNRALYFDRMRQRLLDARRAGSSFAVVMADLDGFKQVNDTLGHDAGDALLRTVATRLRAAIRESDTVARVGGDEFALILVPIDSPEGAGLCAGRILHAMQSPIEISGAACRVGISLGIAIYPQDGIEIDALFSRADQALYAAKRAGKNQYRLVDARARSSEPGTVPFMSWSATHEVGIAIMDQQHRELVDQINRIGDGLKSGHGAAQLGDALGTLLGLTRAHFASEEVLMDRTADDEAAAQHRQEHRRLLADLESLSINLDGTSMALTMRYLQEWLVRHIEAEDRALARAVVRDAVADRFAAAMCA